MQRQSATQPIKVHQWAILVAGGLICVVLVTGLVVNRLRVRYYEEHAPRLFVGFAMRPGTAVVRIPTDNFSLVLASRSGELPEASVKLVISKEAKVIWSIRTRIQDLERCNWVTGESDRILISTKGPIKGLVLPGETYDFELTVDPEIEIAMFFRWWGTRREGASQDGGC